MNHLPAICLAVLLCSGCSTPAAPELEACSEPRPQICTQQYDPVCGVLDGGSKKTYATGCTACSDPNVTGWSPGECP